MGLGMATEHFLRFVSGDFDLKFCSKLRRRNILSKFFFQSRGQGIQPKLCKQAKKKLIVIIIITCYTFARTHPPPPTPSPSLLRPNTYTCIRRGEVKVGGSKSSLPSSLLSQPFIPEAPYTQSQARNCPNRVTNLVTLLLLGSDSGFQRLVMYLRAIFN